MNFIFFINLPLPPSFNIVGEQNSQGSYIATTAIALTSQDNEDGTGILKTEYSLDNKISWQEYIEPIILNQPGEHTIFYQATDRAGNIEDIKQINLIIIESVAEVSIDSLIKKIEELYREKEIKKKSVKNSLIASLKRFKHFSKDTGQNYNSPKNKKGQQAFSKIAKHYQQIKDGVIKKWYKTILEKLKFYLHKKWFTSKAYDIIKTDINILLSNLK